jgi:tripartite-type tricarboxylate transporter receptor subunit TctC
MTDTINRRSIVGALGATSLTAGLGTLGGTLAMPHPLRAQAAFPGSRTIKLVVPFPPAGATDIIGRLWAEKIGSIWGSNVVVENKPGAGGNIGTEQVAKGEQDGSQLLIVSVGMATNQYLYPRLTYDPSADFKPVSLLALVPNLLVVGNHVQARSVSELIAFAKANPGKLTYGSSGVGTSVHLSGELFKKLTGTDMVHLPYRGTAQATQDLIGGRIDLIFDNITQAMSHVRAGSIRALGITTAKRSPVASEFAPVAETVPGFDVSSWFAIFAPKGTPDDVVAKLHADTVRVMADPQVKDRMATLGAEIVASTPAALGSFLKSEMDKWGKLITEAGIKAG